MFSKEKRPPLEGLTKDEEKRRDSLNAEVTRRSLGKPRGSDRTVALDVLREKSTAEPADFIWPLIIGWQLMSARQFVGAIDAFNEAVHRNQRQVRSHWGAGAAYTMAARASQSQGASVTDEMVPVGVPITDLFAAAETCFNSGLAVTTDKDEQDKLQQAIVDVRQAIERSAATH